MNKSKTLEENLVADAQLRLGTSIGVDSDLVSTRKMRTALGISKRALSDALANMTEDEKAELGFVTIKGCVKFQAKAFIRNVAILINRAKKRDFKTSLKNQIYNPPKGISLVELTQKPEDVDIPLKKLCEKVHGVLLDYPELLAYYKILMEKGISQDEIYHATGMWKDGNRYFVNARKYLNFQNEGIQ